MQEFDSRTVMTCSPTNPDQSAYRATIAQFLQPGEMVLTNYGIQQAPSSPLPSLEDRIKQLEQSGDFLSVRTSKEACLDLNGRPSHGAVAIIVIRKSRTPQE